MKTRYQVLIASVLAVATLAAWVAHVSSGPDHEVRFEREAKASIDPQLIATKLQTLSEWNKWFYSLASAQIVDDMNRALPADRQVVKAGERVLLQIDPKRGFKRKFELVGKILRFEPGKELEIEIVEDTSGKVLKSFDRLDWEIEIALPSVRGIEIGHTANWKSRFFSVFAPRILMSQLFYPNIIALADPKILSSAGEAY